MKKTVEEVTLNHDDFVKLEPYLREGLGLDSLDVVELIVKIEDIKGVKIDIWP